jgi:hypothetical protein
MPIAPQIRSADSHDFRVIIGKSVFELVVESLDSSLVPPAKHAQLREDCMQFLARILVTPAGTPTRIVVIGVM